MDWTSAWVPIIASVFIAVAFASFVWNCNKRINKRIEREEAAQRQKDLDEMLANKEKTTRP
jgi:hypothetical protein